MMGGGPLSAKRKARKSDNFTAMKEKRRKTKETEEKYTPVFVHSIVGLWHLAMAIDSLYGFE